MTIMRIRNQVEIDRDIADVFDFVADPRNLPEWVQEVDKAKISAGNGGEGTAFYAMYSEERDRTSRVAGKILEIEEGRRIRLRLEDGDMVVHRVFELSPEGGGTRLVATNELQAKGLVNTLLLPLMKFTGSRKIGQDLSVLRARLEGQAPVPEESRALRREEE